MNIQGWMNVVQVMGALADPISVGAACELFVITRFKKIYKSSH
jgi:hypothetical protein